MKCNECDKCIHHFSCKTKNQESECFNFDYDCEQCQENGFRHYGCSDCCLSEDEYYGEEDE